MIHTFAALNSKGGVGKTTFLANLGGLLADMGARTLLVDADPQPSLTKYFGLAYEAPEGLVEVVTQGVLTSACISRTSVPNLDLVRSNDGDANLQHWLHGRPDARSRLARALRNPYVLEHYDFVLIDTQGAIGPLQDAAVLAADILVSPITPEILSAREFRDGTMELLERLEPGGALGASLGPMKAVIYRQDRSADARIIASGIREDFIKLKGRVAVLETVVPHAKAYKEAATLRVPVHRHERKRDGPTPYGLCSANSQPL